MSNANDLPTPDSAPQINTYGLTDLGYKIFLDRYALKDLNRSSLEVGDTVIAVLNDSKDMSGKREVSIITELHDDQTATIVTQSGQELHLRTEYLDKPLEINPNQLHKRVAQSIASVEIGDKQEEWSQKFEWLMDDWRFIPGGRILTMAGSGHNLSAFNCFVISMPKDSRTGIIDTLEEMAEIMSRGGGVGINISSLRPKNSYVKGVNGRSSGAVSFGALYSFMTGLISQAGSRRGALMLILNDTHPDIYNFIDSKRTAGNITNANISVGISDKFMDAVKADADWDLIFPDTNFENYNELWDGNLDKWQANGYPVVVYRTIKAREMWNKIIESAWSSAEPGLWFRDRANQMSNSYYYDNGYLICTNPCHSGDNLVHTRKGLIPIRDLVGTEFEIVTDLRGVGGSGIQYEKAIAYPTGNKPIYQVTLNNGQIIKLTENHNVYTLDGKKQVSQLVINKDEILIQSDAHKDIYTDINPQDFSEGLMIGWNTGDGWISQFPEDHHGTGINVGFIFSSEKTLAKDTILNDINSKLERKINPRENKGSFEIQTSAKTIVDIFGQYGLFPDTRKTVTQEIFTASPSFKRGYLQGLFASDGSVEVSKKTNSGKIVLVSVNLGLIQGTQILLSEMGIKSSYYTRSQGKGVPYTTKDGIEKISNSRQSYNLCIMGQDDIRKFSNLIGLNINPNKQAKLSEVIQKLSVSKRRSTGYYSKVVSIDLLPNEDVYNITTDITHTLLVNGMLVANCGEQSLSANAVCNLGAINLSRFALNEQMPRDEVSYDYAISNVDWAGLAQATKYAVRFLDNVIDHTYYVTEANKEQEQGERRIGLGIMGLAELMIRVGIRYGSDDSVRFIEDIMHYIARESYIASAENAEEKGAFKWFDADGFLNSGYMQNMDEDVRELVREKGVRNVTLNTIAPTGTTSTMVDTSGGIEPYFSFVFFRQGRLGVHEQRVGLAAEWIDTYATEENQTLPSYFVTAMDLPPEEHVRTMAAAQKWIDSSISKTCNVPNDYTLEQTEQLYMQMYDLGCKGGTIYRDGSRNEQVLHLENPEEKKEEKVHVEPVVISPVINTASDFSTRNKRRPALLNGVTFQVATPYSTNAYVTINEDENRDPYEVFITVGKAGSDLQAQAESIGRLISKSLQIMPSTIRFEGLREIVHQLVGIGGNRSSGFGPNQVRSLPDAIGSAIMKMYFDKREQLLASVQTPVQEDIFKLPAVQMQLTSNDTYTTATSASSIMMTATMPVSTNGHSHNGHSKGIEKNAMTEICPECQNYSLLREEGCKHCISCGYSEC